MKLLCNFVFCRVLISIIALIAGHIGKAVLGILVEKV
jgi:hypothetical protein